jgi:hypothetical protein
LKVKNWTEIAKDGRTWRDLAEKGKNPQTVVMPNYDDEYYQIKRVINLKGTMYIAYYSFRLHVLKLVVCIQATLMSWTIILC